MLKKKGGWCSPDFCIVSVHVEGCVALEELAACHPSQQAHASCASRARGSNQKEDRGWDKKGERKKEDLAWREGTIRHAPSRKDNNGKSTAPGAGVRRSGTAAKQVRRVRKEEKGGRNENRRKKKRGSEKRRK